jgi:hypothetical protein
MKNFLIFSGLILSLALTACSFKKSDTVNAQDQLFEEANDKLISEYKNAEGLYRGEISRPGYSKGIPIELRLIVLSESQPGGSSGKKRQLATLVGVLTQTETNIENIEMTAVFDGNTGRLSLSNSANIATLPESTIASVEGQIKDTRIDGIVKTRQGVLGTLSAALASKSPDQETPSERTARFSRFFQKIVGIYHSKMILHFAGMPEHVENIRFTISASGTIDKPTLIAGCFSELFGASQMTVDYKSMEEPPLISLTKLESSVGTCAYSRLEGKFVDGQVIAHVTSILGDVQEITFTKQTP